jgi:hypothetical protein
MQTTGALLEDALDAILADAKTSIKIYSGSLPDDVEDAATGTLLADCAFDSPADWGDAVAAANKESATSTCSLGSNGYVARDASCNATGTAGYFRIHNAGGAVLQGTCGAAGSGADLLLSTTSITSGTQLTIQSFAITLAYC